MRTELIITVVTFLLSCQMATSVFNSSQSLQDNQETNWSRAYSVEEYQGFESCAKCHKQQLEKYKTTKHFQSYETLHRTAESKAICRKLGVRSVKRDKRCARCHYTPTFSASGKFKASSGVSCENCHGASRDWVKHHNFYGDGDTTGESESLEHKEQRIAKSIELGMRHPANVFLLARSCYSCHLVNDAELVNDTAHPFVSDQFNFIAWSQGRMRHNYFRTGGKENAVSDSARQRLMYVADLIAACEVAINEYDPQQRAPLSEYQTGIRTVISAKLKKLDQAFGLTKNPLIGRARFIMAQFLEGKLTKESAANSLRTIGFEIGQGADITGLENLDSHLPPPSSYIN